MKVLGWYSVIIVALALLVLLVDLMMGESPSPGDDIITIAMLLPVEIYLIKSVRSLDKVPSDDRQTGVV